MSHLQLAKFQVRLALEQQRMPSSLVTSVGTARVSRHSGPWLGLVGVHLLYCEICEIFSLTSGYCCWHSRHCADVGRNSMAKQPQLDHGKCAGLARVNMVYWCHGLGAPQRADMHFRLEQSV